MPSLGEKCPQIELNLHSKSHLPYIQINNPPIKLLIDTGANESFISPEAYEKFYPHIPLVYEPFLVTNTHVTTQNYYSLTVPCFDEFKDYIPIKLYLYKFHNFFDGLIGCDQLKKWNAKIDLATHTLETKFTQIPIILYSPERLNSYQITIPAQTTQLIKVPTNIAQGDIYIEEQPISDCYISECLSSAENNHANVQISNPTDNDIVISIGKPIFAHIFNEQTMPVTRVETTVTTDMRAQQVLSHLRIEHLNAEETANLLNLCKEYSDVFYLENEPLTFTNEIKHHIRTIDDSPVYSKSYRYPYVHRKEVQNQIESMLHQGIIQPSSSPWNAPIWIVPKKSDASGKVKWRLVIDFRQLNAKTINDKYPIPNINDILDKLGRCLYFSTLDLKSGFLQIQLNPSDIPKTAFSVEQGHFEYVRMPMGLKNSPATFQRVMDNVLHGLPNCTTYMDDILVFSTSLQEHIVNLRAIFERLRNSNLKIQMDKSEFLKHETPYLGHIITTDGVKPNPDKISAIVNYPVPKTPKQIKAFLGLLGYYRRFIPNFARVTKPFTSCLKKGAKINLTPEYLACFEHCKTLLTNDPILTYPDFSKEFILTTDASNVALGAILSQGPIGSDKPIAYASRTLNDSEINYSTIEKELLAIVWATKYFRPYLFGREFKIITDHKPLIWLMNLKEPGSRLTRWRLRLAEYDYTIVHKKGKINTNADALSRIQINQNETMSLFVNHSETAHSDTSSTLTAEGNSPVHSSSTLTAHSIMAGGSNDPQHQESTASPHIETIHTSLENPVLEIPISDEPLNKFKRQLVINIINGSPKNRPTTTQPFQSFQKTTVDINEHNLEGCLINVIKSHVDPELRTAILVNPIEKMLDIIPILQQTFENSSMNLVLVKHEVLNINDQSNQLEVIKKYHEGKTNHRGINETYLSLSQRYFWPKIKIDITKFINECNICRCAKYDRNPIRPQFRIVPPPTQPFELAHADVLTLDHDKYLTIIDSFSKYAQAYLLPDCTAPNILKALLTYSTHYGFPLNLTTDQGTEFNNQVVSEFLRLHKIEHHMTSAYTPNENGIIERFHSTLLEHLRLLKIQHKNEPTRSLIPYALIAYNSSIHSLTKCRPFDVLTGHFDPRNPIDLNMTDRYLQTYIQEHRSRMETVYKIIHDSALSNRIGIMTRRNADREPVLDYEQNQVIHLRNPMASRQKLAPRFTQDKVVKNLPVHIYTAKSRGPVAKSRLKRPSKK